MTTWKQYMQSALNAMEAAFHMLEGEHCAIESQSLLGHSNSSTGSERSSQISSTIEETNNIIINWMVNQKMQSSPTSLPLPEEILLLDSSFDTVKQNDNLVLDRLAFLSMKHQGSQKSRMEINKEINRSPTKEELPSVSLKFDSVDPNFSIPSTSRFTSSCHEESVPKKNTTRKTVKSRRRARMARIENKLEYFCDDPVQFYLDMANSPPGITSSPRCQQEFDFNRMMSQNGDISNIVSVLCLEKPALDQSRHKKNIVGCHLEICQAMPHFIVTTPENVKDKQMFLKEIFNSVSQLLRSAANACPASKLEEIIELSGSVILINNAFGNDATMESFQKILKTAKHLVFLLKSTIRSISAEE
uniref:Uncharacterized protein n=1 Tax=Caenorhabditis japonica TaxID=281687 RepID=A0A8R1DXP8_CAEJA